VVEKPEYELDPTAVVIPEGHARYFEKLEQTQGVKLSAAKRAWYVKKAETQLADMKREYPSTPEEAFEASIEGAYFANQHCLGYWRWRLHLDLVLATNARQDRSCRLLPKLRRGNAALH
jgi:hypothetical protein